MTRYEQLPARPSKGKRRINTILQRIPAAREQLLVAIEVFPSDFDITELIAAAESPTHASATRWRSSSVGTRYCSTGATSWPLACSGQRVGAVEKTSGYPWERL